MERPPDACCSYSASSPVPSFSSRLGSGPAGITGRSSHDRRADLDHQCCGGRATGALAQAILRDPGRRLRRARAHARLGASTIRFNSCFCSGDSFGLGPGALALISPARPSLKRCTQSHNVCRSMAPISAAASRLIPSRTAASDNRRRACPASSSGGEEQSGMGAARRCHQGHQQHPERRERQGLRRRTLKFPCAAHLIGVAQRGAARRRGVRVKARLSGPNSSPLSGAGVLYPRVFAARLRGLSWRMA
jgi:hypothetical protein